MCYGYHGRKKRSVQDEPIILDESFLPNLLQTIKKIPWPYKVNSAQLQQRDQALTAFFLIGTRNSEKQTIKKKQTYNYKNHILIANVKSLKNGNLRQKIILPKTGDLAPFTQIFEIWLTQVPDENSVLFPAANAATGTLNWSKPLGRNRIHWIIKTTSGMFPH